MTRLARICILTALTLALAASAAAQASPEFAVGLWHRPLSDADARTALWERCERAGVTDLFVHTFYHGFTIYPSNAERTFEEWPDLEGQDLLQTYIDEGHSHGIRVHAWLDLLLWGPDHERMPDVPRNQYADTHPEWRVADAGGYTTRQIFVTPAHHEVSNLVTLLCLEIAHHHPEIDGIQLDQVRYPGGGDFIYDAASLSMFATPDHPDPRDSDDPAVLNSYRSLCEANLSGLVEQIALVMRGIHGDSIEISAAVIPTAPDSGEIDLRHQRWWDWTEQGTVDLAVPRCFGNDAETIRAQAQCVASVTAEQGVPCWVGLARRPGDEERPTLSEQLEAIADLPIQGITLYCDSWLAEDERELDAVHEWVSARTAP